MGYYEMYQNGDKCKIRFKKGIIDELARQNRRKQLRIQELEEVIQIKGRQIRRLANENYILNQKLNTNSNTKNKTKKNEK